MTRTTTSGECTVYANWQKRRSSQNFSLPPPHIRFHLNSNIATVTIIFLGGKTYNATSGKTTGILPCLEPRRLLKEHLCETKRLHFASVTITILNDCHTHLINNDCPNIKLFLRNPVAQSTDGARGKIGFRCSLRSFSHHSAIFFHLLTQVWSTCMGGDMGRTIGDCCGDRYKSWMS